VEGEEEGVVYTFVWNDDAWIGLGWAEWDETERETEVDEYIVYEESVYIPSFILFGFNCVPLFMLPGHGWVSGAS